MAFAPKAIPVVIVFLIAGATTAHANQLQPPPRCGELGACTADEFMEEWLGESAEELFPHTYLPVRRFVSAGLAYGQDRPEVLPEHRIWIAEFFVQLTGFRDSERLLSMVEELEPELANDAEFLGLMSKEWSALLVVTQRRYLPFLADDLVLIERALFSRFEGDPGLANVGYLSLAAQVSYILSLAHSCSAYCRLLTYCALAAEHGLTLTGQPIRHPDGICGSNDLLSLQSGKWLSSCPPCEGEPSVEQRLTEVMAFALRPKLHSEPADDFLAHRDMVLRQFNMLRFFLADIEEEILDLAVLDILEAHPSVIAHYAEKLDERVLTHDGFANFLVTGFAPPRMSNESSRDRKLRRDRALEDLLARRLHDEEWSADGRRVLADSLVRLAHQQAVLFPESPDAPAAMARAADYLAAYEGEHGRFPHEQTRTEVRERGEAQ